MTTQEEEIQKLTEERDELRRENERLREHLRARGRYEAAVADELVPEDYVPKW